MTDMMNNLKLELLNESHADAMIYFLNDDVLLQPFLNPLNPVTEKITKDVFLKTNMEWLRQKNAYMFAIIVDSTVIGMTTLLILPDDDSIARTGVWIGSQYWNNGYSTHRLKLLIDIAKQYKIKKMISKIRKDNPASKRVWEKCSASFTEEEHFFYASIVI